MYVSKYIITSQKYTQAQDSVGVFIIQIQCKRYIRCNNYEYFFVKLKIWKVTHVHTFRNDCTSKLAFTCNISIKEITHTVNHFRENNETSSIEKYFSF